MYSFPPFYSIWSHTLRYFFNWHVIFLLILLMLFLVFLFVFSTWINLLFLTRALVTLTWLNHLKRISLIFSSIGATPIFKQIFSFQILSFLVFPLIHLNILISTTLILWVCFFLTAHLHSIFISNKEIYQRKESSNGELWAKWVTRYPQA